VDSQGNILVIDSHNHRIRRITHEGEVTTIAGSGAASFADVPGFNHPEGIVVDREGNIYVSDSGNNCIRKITSDSFVTTLAGDGSTVATSFQDGTGTDTRFSRPLGIAVDGDGNLFVADTGNHRIRQVTPDGTETTVAGSGARATTDGTGIAAAFHRPYGITIDPEGNLIVTEYTSHRIRRIIAGLAPPLPPGLPQPEVPSSTHFEENKIMLGGPTFADVESVVKAVDDQAWW